MYRLCIVLLACSFVAVQATTGITTCKKGAAPLSVDIKGCDEAPCNVVKGKNATMLWHFAADRDYSALTAKAKGYLGFIGTSYPLDSAVADVCSNLLDDAYCPIYESEDVVYKVELFIETWFPELPVRVQLTLEDQNGDEVQCFSVNIKVTS